MSDNNKPATSREVNLTESDLQQSTAVLHSIRRASLLVSIGDLVSDRIGLDSAGVELCVLFAPGICLPLHRHSFPLHRRIRMCLLVLGQVVTSCEALVAQQTGELLLPCVGANVPLQFVRAGEAFPAEQPVANKGALAGVPAQVGFEVRGLVVDFPTARDVAAVDWLLSQGGSRGPQPLQLLAVGAVT